MGRKGKWKENACAAETVIIQNGLQNILLMPYYIPGKGTDVEFEVCVWLQPICVAI